MDFFDNVITMDMIKILKVKNEWLLNFLDNEKKIYFKKLWINSKENLLMQNAKKNKIKVMSKYKFLLY